MGHTTGHFAEVRPSVSVCHWLEGESGPGAWGGGALPIVSSTGMCRGNAPVLSHFTLNLSMQKPSFTFIMPTKFIPCVMAMTFHNNTSKIFCRVMQKTDLSIKFRPWKSIICIYQYYRTIKITVQNILLWAHGLHWYAALTELRCYTGITLAHWFAP